jgi:predicted O-methyltransferase YrrM
MTELLTEMKQFAEERHLPILRDAELPLFHNLLCQARPGRVLEIGTCIGYSALQMAPFLAPGGTITTIELDADRVAAARHFISKSPYAAQIRLVQGDATIEAGRLEGPWDFVFLDGPKGQYQRQLEKIIPKLLPQALIVADNVRYHDMVYISGNLPHKHRTAIVQLRKFMDMIQDRAHFETVCFENGDGLTVSQWKG